MARESLRTTDRGDHPPRLLIVDDDPLTQGRVRRVIQAARPSWELLRAETVEAALRELAAWGSVDAVLTGELSGGCIQLLDAVRTRFPNITRILHVESPSRASRTASANSHATVSADAPTDELVGVLDRLMSDRQRPSRSPSGVRSLGPPAGPERKTSG